MAPLGRDGSDRRACDAPAKNDHKQGVQQDVDDRRGSNGDHGRPAVAYCPQERRAQIARHHQRQSAENHAQIQQREAVGFLRRLQQPQKEGQRALSEQLERSDRHHSQQHALPRRAFQPFMIRRAEAMGNLDGKALGQSNRNAGQRPVQPARGCDRGQRRHPILLAHNERVHNGIDLLQKIARDDGQRKCHDQPDGIADGHIFGVAHRLSPGSGRMESLCSDERISRLSLLSF